MHGVTGWRLLAVAVALAGTAACTSGSSPTGAGRSGTPAPSSPAGPATPAGGATSPAGGATSPAGVTPTGVTAASGDADVPAAYVRELRFLTPSGRIGCAMFTEPDGKASAACDLVGRRNWTPPPAPADCEGDYGNGVFLVTGERARLTCSTDTIFDQEAPVLPYGSSLRLGRLQCTSTREGVRCRQLRTGHHFLLGSTRYELG